MGKPTPTPISAAIVFQRGRQTMIKGVTRNTRSETSTKKKNKIVLDSVWGRRCRELQFCTEKTEGGKSKPAGAQESANLWLRRCNVPGKPESSQRSHCISPSAELISIWGQDHLAHSHSLQ